jgi:hypothetical protein
MNGELFAAALAALPLKSADEMIAEKSHTHTVKSRQIGKTDYVPTGRPATSGMLKLLAYRLTKKGYHVKQGDPSALHPAEFKLLQSIKSGRTQVTRPGSFKTLIGDQQ